MKKKVPNRALKIVQGFYPFARKVVDSLKTIAVEVTEQDDRNAKLKNHKTCAFAVACKRKCHADGVIISVRTAYVIKGTIAYRFRVPESTAREVISFDRKGGFSPGRYRLNAPAASERLGTRQSGKTHNKSDRKSPKWMHHTDRIRTSLLITA